MQTVNNTSILLAQVAKQLAESSARAVKYSGAVGSVLTIEMSLSSGVWLPWLASDCITGIGTANVVIMRALTIRTAKNVWKLVDLAGISSN